jgi:hypothetical protein
VLRQHLQTIATLATPLALPVVRYEGLLHGSLAPARLVTAALAPTADFLAGSLMAVEKREARPALPSPLALSGKHFRQATEGADIVAAEVPWLWRFALPAGAGQRFPSWVSQEIWAPPGGRLEVPAAVRKEAARHSRRGGYSVEFAPAGDRIEEFYEDFYRPYVSRRFATGALIVAAERFRAVGRGMSLARLEAGGRWVAGMLFRIAGGTLQLGWFGARTVPAPAGASEVLDVRVIEHAASAGAMRAVLGHSRPSLADGVVRYKARFGAVIRATRFPQRVIGIDARGPTAEIVQAVNAARFVSFSGRGPEMRVLDFRPAL